MKIAVITLVGFIVFSACKKDDLHVGSSKFYNSKGNLLLLVVSDSLEGLYEYNLETTALINDSLPIHCESVQENNPWWNKITCRFTPNSDTLFWHEEQTFEFMEDFIPNSHLATSPPVSFDINKFQLISGSVNTDFEKYWDMVSNLSIVRTYINLNPNSKIGISREVIFEYDTILEFKIPIEKHFIYLVR